MEQPTSKKRKEHVWYRVVRMTGREMKMESDDVNHLLELIYGLSLMAHGTNDYSSP